MSRILNILAPTRYPWRFNAPRTSRHNVSVRLFVPFNKLSPKIEGITLFNPFPLQRFDLIHAFNRIPISSTPFIIGFESHLPRAFGYEDSPLCRAMSGALASKRCKAIIAISDYARRQFLQQHINNPQKDMLAAKLSVRYPNLPIPSGLEKVELRADEPIRVVFVGNHFGRKGGSIAVRLAELSHQRGLPLQVDIISSLEMGDVSWVSPTRTEYWNHDIHLIRSLPNIRHHSQLPNADLTAMMRKAHFVLLPTFSDSFGYSTIEAMSFGTPVIATKQCALPEFISDGVNGIALDLGVNEAGEWQHAQRTDRASSDYEALFEREVARLTKDAYTKIESYIQSSTSYLSLRMQAHQTAEKLFSANAASKFWDDFYVRVLSS